MKKTMLIEILFLSMMFLVSCSKSPQEKIVGEWINEHGFGFLITLDGNVKGIKDSEVTDNEGVWELNDEEILVFNIFDDGELTFINDDEIEYSIPKQGEKIILKRGISNIRTRKEAKAQMIKSINEKGHLGTFIDIIKNPKMY